MGCVDRHRTRLMDLTAEKFTFIQKSCVKMRQAREYLPSCTPTPHISLPKLETYHFHIVENLVARV